jgi:putative endonuclease
MKNHIQTGKLDEKLAVKWLEKQGFEILNCNWRTGHLEIDIIAQKENLLHFIEVKTGSTDLFGFPELRISRRKIIHMAAAAERFLISHNCNRLFQLDAISVIIHKNIPEYYFIEDIIPEI